MVTHLILNECRSRHNETLDHVSAGSRHQGHIDVMDVNSKHDVKVTLEVTIEIDGVHLRISGPCYH